MVNEESRKEKGTKREENWISYIILNFQTIYVRICVEFYFISVITPL